MKSYLQGLITGGVLVFSFIVLTAQNLPLESLIRQAEIEKYPIGRYQYGMMRLTDTIYYSWFADTMTSETIVRKFDLEELKEKPGYAGTVFNVSIPLFKTYSKM